MDVYKRRIEITVLTFLHEANYQAEYGHGCYGGLVSRSLADRLDSRHTAMWWGWGWACG